MVLLEFLALSGLLVSAMMAQQDGVSPQTSSHQKPGTRVTNRHFAGSSSLDKVKLEPVRMEGEGRLDLKAFESKDVQDSMPPVHTSGSQPQDQPVMTPDPVVGGGEYDVHDAHAGMAHKRPSGSQPQDQPVKTPDHVVRGGEYDVHDAHAGMALKRPSGSQPQDQPVKTPDHVVGAGEYDVHDAHAGMAHKRPSVSQPQDQPVKTPEHAVGGGEYDAKDAKVSISSEHSSVASGNPPLHQSKMASVRRARVFESAAYDVNEAKISVVSERPSAASGNPRPGRLITTSSRKDVKTAANDVNDAPANVVSERPSGPPSRSQQQIVPSHAFGKVELDITGAQSSMAPKPPSGPPPPGKPVKTSARMVGGGRTVSFDIHDAPASMVPGPSSGRPAPDQSKVAPARTMGGRETPDLIGTKVTRTPRPSPVMRGRGWDQRVSQVTRGRGRGIPSRVTSKPIVTTRVEPVLLSPQRPPAPGRTAGRRDGALGGMRIDRETGFRLGRTPDGQEGYFGALAGVAGMPFMGGIGPDEPFSNGGVSLGLQDGIGTGSKQAYLERRRTGTENISPDGYRPPSRSGGTRPGGTRPGGTRTSGRRRTRYPGGVDLGSSSRGRRIRYPDVIGNPGMPEGGADLLLPPRGGAGRRASGRTRSRASRDRGPRGVSRESVDRSRLVRSGDIGIRPVRRPRLRTPVPSEILFPVEPIPSWVAGVGQRDEMRMLAQLLDLQGGVANVGVSGPGADRGSRRGRGKGRSRGDSRRPAAPAVDPRGRRTGRRRGRQPVRDLGRPVVRPGMGVPRMPDTLGGVGYTLPLDRVRAGRRPRRL